MKKLVKFLIQRSILGNILTVAVVVLGIVVMSGMKREAFPNINFDIVVITVIYPGASPQEVEKLITIPIEREVKSIDGIKKSSSTSIENRSAISLTLEPELEDKAVVIQEIKDAVDIAKIDFPEDTEDPVVTEVKTSRQGVLEIALSGPEETMDEFKLRKYAERLSDKIELLEDVATVSRRGYREREIHVEVFPDKLEFYNISADEISTALRNRNLNLPGGNVIDQGKEYGIRTIKEFQNLDEIRNLTVRANDLGGTVKIKDVAFVRNDFENKELIEKAGGTEAIILTVLKKEAGDAIDLVDSVYSLIEEFKKTAGDGLTISTFNDLAFYVKRRLKVLVGNVSIGMVLVVISLFFFLGWRVSLMVALGIPFSFAITFLVMNYVGISVNLLSMFGLVIVSGMIVDDAIVVGENIYRHIENGLPPVQAAIVGAQEMLVPVFGAITTTMIAFTPLMFMGGIMGKFVWIIPAGVVIALAASLFESFFILPAHISDISKGDPTLSVNRHKRKASARPRRLDAISLKMKKIETSIMENLKKVYLPALKACLRHRYLVMMTVLLLFILSVFLIRQIGFILFPKQGIEILLIRADSASGVSLEEMNQRIKPIENAVLNLEENELDSFSSRVGIHQRDPNDPFTKRGKNYAQVNIYLTPEQNRTRKAKEIINYLKRKLKEEKPVYSVNPVKGTSASYLLVDNSSEIRWVSSNEPHKPYRNETVSEDFLLGGALLADGQTFLGYSGKNELFKLNLQTKEKEFSQNISLPKLDSVVEFLYEPQKDMAVFYTERGYLYQVDISDASTKRIKKYSTQITSARLVPEEGLLLLSYEKGVDIWDYTEERWKLKDSIQKGTKYSYSELKFVSGKQGSLERIENVSFDPGQKQVLVNTQKGMVRIYDIESKKFVEEYRPSEQPIFWSMVDPSNPEYLWYSTQDSLACFDRKKLKSLYEKAFVGRIQKSILRDQEGETLLLGTFGSVLKLRSGEPKAELLKNGKRILEKVEYLQMGGGPPVGSPVQVEIRGDDFETSLSIVEEIKNILSTLDGVYGIRDNWEEGKEEFHVQVNEARAAMAGINIAQLGRSLQTAFEGSISTSIKKANEEIDIRVIFPEDLRERLSSLKKVKIRNQYGSLVPITELATFKKQPGVPLISHADFRRTVYVQANLDESKTSSVDVNQKILKKIVPIAQKNPGYEIITGGEYEDTQESLGDLRFSAAVAGLGIAMILVLLFGNLRVPRTIMSAIPLGLIGVSLAFFVHRVTFQPELTFSFLATMGIVGLTGVVVNDSIVMIDFIQKFRNTGIGKMEAIIKGCLSRLRPVLLTTITTTLGLFPTAYGIGGDDPFLKPMALALSWGLLFASLITLIVTPVYYSIWEERGLIFHHVKASIPGVRSELAEVGKK